MESNPTKPHRLTLSLVGTQRKTKGGLVKRERGINVEQTQARVIHQGPHHPVSKMLFLAEGQNDYVIGLGSHGQEATELGFQPRIPKSCSLPSTMLLCIHCPPHT